MQVRLKTGLIVLTAELDEAAVADWSTEHADHAFVLRLQDERTCLLQDLGPRLLACREPINVVSTSKDAAARLISNFAHTPFELHGRAYASIEAFWQGLKFPSEDDRRRIAPLHGPAAKRAGAEAPEAELFAYEGATCRFGSYDHWKLMSKACWAKFTQHQAARQALLGTGERPLIHRLPRGRDSRTIPGLIMADIWMKLRTRLVNQERRRQEQAKRG